MKKICITLMVAMIVALALADTELGADDFVNHGVAVNISGQRGAVAGVDGQSNRIFCVWVADVMGCHTKLIIDIDSGETEALDVPRIDNEQPFSVLLSRRGKWYTQNSGHMYEFDFEDRNFSFIGRTPPGVAISMTEDGDGLIWMGFFSDSRLVSFDPETKKIKDYGSLNKEDWSQYPNDIAYDDKGWIYIGLRYAMAQVIGYNPADGEIRTYIPEEKRGPAYGVVRRRTDGKVYANVNAAGGPGVDWDAHVLYGGEAVPAEEEKVDFVKEKTGTAWRTRFWAFPDGSEVTHLSMADRRLTIREADGTERDVEFDYKSGGSGIFSIVLGPDDNIYGATRGYAFKYNLDSGSFLHHVRGGHLNAMAVQRGMVFGARYPYGELYAYDLSTPWDDNDAGDKLYMAQPDIGRPHVLNAHPDGKSLIMGGTPGYGQTGGGLLIYDLDAGSGEIFTHEDLSVNQSPWSLVVLPDENLLVGTTIQTGTGGERKADRSGLYIFDFENRKVIWSGEATEDGRRITDLTLGRNGLVYGMAGERVFFVFDPETREVVHSEDLGEVYGLSAGAWQAMRCMTVGPEGDIYVLFRKAIVRICPDSFAHTKLADTPVEVTTGIILFRGRLYFTHRSQLWSCRISS